MSAKDMVWAITRKHKHVNDLAVLSVIACSQRDGWTFMSQDTIAKRCIISRKSVNESLKRLEDSGLIKRVQRWNGNVRTTDHIQILPPHRCNSELQPLVTDGYSIPTSPYGVGNKGGNKKKNLGHGLRVVGGRDA